MSIEAERAAAAFLAGEPDYDEPAWIDAYSMLLGACRPELKPNECVVAARAAWQAQGWANPKTCAYLDAQLGLWSDE